MEAHGYRQAAFTARQTRDLVFDRLPPAVGDRLTQGVVHGVPEPLLTAPSGRAPPALSAAIASLSIAVVATLGVAMWGLGEVRAPYGFQPEAFAVIYGALAGVMVLAGAAVVKRRTFLRGAPFRSGRYLFPLDLVEASGGRLRVTSLDTLRGAEAQGREVALVFEDGHAVLFPSPWGEGPEEAAARVNEAITAARALAFPADEAELRQIDPFFEVRVTENWDAAAGTGDRGRSQIGRLAAAALVVAAPAGVAILHARNAFSDDLMFNEARIQRTREGYGPQLEAYAAVGHRHQEEVGQLLVQASGDDTDVLRRYMSRGDPIATLADEALFARAKGDEQRLAEYVHHGGRHADEADEALFALVRRQDTVSAYTTYLENGKRHADEVRRDLLPDADFAQASRSTLVGPLFSFVRRNPGAKHEDEAWRRIRATYAGALTAFEATHRPTAEGRRFVEALLTALQDRADPQVTLAIITGDASSVAHADATLDEMYFGRYRPAADRLDLGRLSAGTRRAVEGWFARTFDHGAVEVAAIASPEDAARPRIEVRLSAVAYGSAHFSAPGAAENEPPYVTPLVGFDVEVRGRVAGRDAQELIWHTTIADTPDGKMPTTRSDFGGQLRVQHAGHVDGLEYFLEGVPAGVAASFNGQL